MSLLDQTIQYFPGKIWLPKPLGEISLKQFIDSHKKPRKQIKEIFKQIAEAEKKEDWETKGKLKQNNLFYFTPCVKFNGKSRGYADIESFTGFMVLDFDHLEIGAEEFRDRLFKKYKCIVCTYKSPSSNGVKAIVRIPIVDSVDEFKQYFYAMCMEMAKVKSFDVSCRNPALPLFLSWDENIRYREDATLWENRAGKYDEFEPHVGDFKEIEDITDLDKKEVLRRVHNVIKKADQEKVGHQHCVSASCLLGGFIVTGYLTYDEAENYLFKWIDQSDYLSKKSSTYKKTAITMLNKGMGAPLYLERHQDKEPEEVVKKTDRAKRDSKYYRLCPLNKFNLQRVK
jgi:hypothetical protein